MYELSHRFSLNQLFLILPDRVVHPQSQRQATGAETHRIPFENSQSRFVKTPCVLFLCTCDILSTWRHTEMDIWGIYGRVEYVCAAECASCSRPIAVLAIGRKRRWMTTNSLVDRRRKKFGEVSTPVKSPMDRISNSGTFPVLGETKEIMCVYTGVSLYASTWCSVGSVSFLCLIVCVPYLKNNMQVWIADIPPAGWVQSVFSSNIQQSEPGSPALGKISVEMMCRMFWVSFSDGRFKGLEHRVEEFLSI